MTSLMEMSDLLQGFPSNSDTALMQQDGQKVDEIRLQLHCYFMTVSVLLVVQSSLLQVVNNSLFQTCSNNLKQLLNCLCVSQICHDLFTGLFQLIRFYACKPHPFDSVTYSSFLLKK